VRHLRRLCPALLTLGQAGDASFPGIADGDRAAVEVLRVGIDAQPVGQYRGLKKTTLSRLQLRCGDTPRAAVARPRRSAVPSIGVHRRGSGADCNAYYSVTRVIRYRWGMISVVLIIQM
jgi:hypothetical protein